MLGHGSRSYKRRRAPANDGVSFNWKRGTSVAPVWAARSRSGRTAGRPGLPVRRPRPILLMAPSLRFFLSPDLKPRQETSKHGVISNHRDLGLLDKAKSYLKLAIDLDPGDRVTQ